MKFAIVIALALVSVSAFAAKHSKEAVAKCKEEVKALKGAEKKSAYKACLAAPAAPAATEAKAEVAAPAAAPATK